MKKLAFIILILVFAGLEILLGYNDKIGLAVYAFLIGIILIAFESDEALSHSDKLLIFIMIIPIARIAEIFINFSLFWKTLMFYFVIFFLVLFYTFKFKVKLFTKKNLKWLPLGIILGALLGYGGNYLVGFEKHFELIWLLPLIAFSEEALFRGMIQNYAEKEYGALFAIITTSLLFGVFSLSFGFKFAGLMIAANLLICLIYKLTKNIWVTIPLNFFMNLLLFVMTLGGNEIFTTIW